MAHAELKCSINRTVRAQASNVSAEPVRKSANYHPCIWAKHFATYTPDYSTISFKEYMDIARVTVGFPPLSIAAVLGMGEVAATREALEWLRSTPPIVVSGSYICRIIDDLHEPYKFEYGTRDHVDSCVDCYVREKGVIGPEAKLALRKEVDLHWKELNQALLRPTAFPSPILLPMLNLPRSGEVYYFLGDNFGDSTGFARDVITTLLVDPIPV